MPKAVSIEGKSGKNIFSEAMVIAAMPVFGYALAFTYEFGFAYHFKIPWQFIQVTLPEVIYAVIILLIYVFAVLQIVTTAIGLGINQLVRGPLGGKIAFSIILLFAWSLLGAMFGFGIAVKYIFVPLIYILAEFLWPLFYERGRPYKFKVQSEMMAESKAPSIITYGFSFIGRLNTWIIFWAVMALWFSFMIGNAAASNQQAFLVNDIGKSKEVVLQVFGDRVVTAPLTESDQVLPEFTMNQLGQGPAITFRLEQIGKLRIR